MRDLESLDQAGIPIQSFYGVEGGYQIMDNFVMEKQVAASEDDIINGQLILLEDAIEKKCVVRFSYTNSHDEVKEIQVEPVCLQL